MDTDGRDYRPTDVLLDTVVHGGYRVTAKVHLVGGGHPEKAKWIGGEYVLCSDGENTYSERKIVHTPSFHMYKQEAIRHTLAIAVQDIDEGRLSL